MRRSLDSERREGRWFVWLIVVLAGVVAVDSFDLLPGSKDAGTGGKTGVLGEVIVRGTSTTTTTAVPATAAPVTAPPARVTSTTRATVATTTPTTRARVTTTTRATTTTTVEETTTTSPFDPPFPTQP